MTTPRPVIVAYEPLTVELEREAANAIDDFIRDHSDELNEVLKPYGITHTDIARPNYRRFATPNEIRTALAEEASDG
ncbi:hypothetical protein [Microcella alkaliphila]|uniref:Protein translocase subunit SecA n=1 Tax=Microcella alkaliphila TaxID=279828 RepID=A0A0U5BPC8_9MICO|nr:hypothetical protein [Microcella alkaliphila]BAU32476.1 protein translocase subunit SecA [Microcella alkaliphila]